MTGVYTNIAKKRIEQSKDATVIPPQLDEGPKTTSPSSSSLSQSEQNPGKPEITKSGIHENVKSGIHENPETRLPENLKSGKPEIMNAPLSNYVKPEKYSTQLRPGLKQKLAVYATLNQMKDYEVLEEALDEFFEKHK